MFAYISLFLMKNIRVLMIDVARKLTGSWHLHSLKLMELIILILRKSHLTRFKFWNLIVVTSYKIA